MTSVKTFTGNREKQFAGVKNPCPPLFVEGIFGGFFLAHKRWPSSQWAQYTFLYSYCADYATEGLSELWDSANSTMFSGTWVICIRLWTRGRDVNLRVSRMASVWACPGTQSVNTVHWCLKLYVFQTKLSVSSLLCSVSVSHVTSLSCEKKIFDTWRRSHSFFSHRILFSCDCDTDSRVIPISDTPLTMVPKEFASHCVDFEICYTLNNNLCVCFCPTWAGPQCSGIFLPTKTEKKIALCWHDTYNTDDASDKISWTTFFSVLASLNTISIFQLGVLKMKMFTVSSFIVWLKQIKRHQQEHLNWNPHNWRTKSFVYLLGTLIWPLLIQGANRDCFDAIDWGHWRRLSLMLKVSEWDNFFFRRYWGPSITIQKVVDQQFCAG